MSYELRSIANHIFVFKEDLFLFSSLVTIKAKNDDDKNRILKIGEKSVRE